MTQLLQQKQRLPYSKRHTLPLRLEKQAHAELVKASENEQRSMAYIAMRRYQAGLALEAETNPSTSS